MLRAVGPTFRGMGSGNEEEEDLDRKEEEGIHSLMVEGLELDQGLTMRWKDPLEKSFFPSPPLLFPSSNQFSSFSFSSVLSFTPSAERGQLRLRGRS